MFVYSNPNPSATLVGDCAVRAISIAEGKDWDETYINLAIQGLLMKDMPSSNRVWGAYLKGKGYERKSVFEGCSDCFSVQDFCQAFPRGTFILGTGTHVVTVIDGDYMDTWDSGNETPVFYYERR